MKRLREEDVGSQQAAAVGAVFRALCEALAVPVAKDDAFRLLDRLCGDQRSSHDEQQEEYESLLQSEQDSEAAPLPPGPVQEEGGTSCSIYALELDNGYYYVGRSETEDGADARIEDHRAGNGCKWSKKHPFVSVLYRKSNCSSFQEDFDTLQLMAEKGIDRVRGGTFCNIALEQYQHRAAKDMIVTATNCCYKCLKPGHCRNACPEQ